MTAARPIIFVSPPLTYSASTLYTLGLATALLERGIALQVVTAGGRFEHAFRERGIDLAVEPNLDRFLLDRLPLRRLVRDLDAAGGARLVHAQAAVKAATAATLARRLEVPALVTIHRYYDPLRHAGIDWTAFGAAITQSEDLRADIVNRRRAPRDIVHVIPAGVAAGPPVVPPFSRDGAAPVIGAVGEVDRPELQEEFARAAKAVLGRVPDAQFLIVGQGAEPRALRAAIRAQGVSSSFTVTDVIDHRKVLREMDICVMVSEKEGAGHAVIDTMAAGRPVIAVGTGGAFEVIRDEETGILVDKTQPGALGEAVLRLLLDRDLARRLGARAREVVLEKYPLDRMIDETLGVYDRLAGAARV